MPPLHPAFTFALPLALPPSLPVHTPSSLRKRPCPPRATARRPPSASLPAQPGRTYLVGAGPGGLDHLTHRAARLISTADVIVTDALADPDILALRRPGAEVVRVGKRGWSAESVPQAEISALLVEIATAAGKRSVVRLKAGDPCLFGRAAEEMAALTEAGCEVDVVPGVTSVSAAAAAVGVSLTEKSVGRSVVTVSGHDVDGIDYGMLARCDVVTVLMAGRGFREIMRRIAATDELEGDGKGAGRDVSVVQWAGREERQVVLRAGIAEIADVVESELPDGISPAVVIVSRAR